MATTVKDSKSFTDQLSYMAIGLIWLLTSLATFTASNSQALTRYDISRSDLLLLQIIFSLPGLVIWLCTLYAALSFYRYAKSIKGSKDGPGFLYIAYGLTALLATMIASSILSSIQALSIESVANAPETATNFVIVRNYLSVAAALVAYGGLLWGGRSLLASINKQLGGIKDFWPGIAGFVGLAAIYLALVFANPSRQMSTDPNIPPTFGLSDPLILLTVALPQLIAWAMGILSLVALYKYRMQTSGVVYKLLFKKLLTGMTLVIALSIGLQMLAQFSSFLASSGLGFILLLVTVIYVVLVFAFLSIAHGAQRLNKIETIQ